MLSTNKQTNKQTNQCYQKHNFLCQGGNYACSNIATVTFVFQGTFLTSYYAQWDDKVSNSYVSISRNNFTLCMFTLWMW